ncbi:MAG: hypothetical protein HYV07_25365 [Deltaproteobacteria bacterium]|nr:hypothetical protein [Deltaproteobacteria bacterium]
MKFRKSIAALPVMLTCALAQAEGSVDYDPESGWYERPKHFVQISHAERPITLPARHFGLDFSLDYTRLNKRVPLTVLRASGGYGVSDDLEVGVELIEWSFSPDPRSGLGAPTAWVGYRLVSGLFEAAAVLEGDVPIAGIRLEARLPMILRLGEYGRFDSAPGVRAAVAASIVPTVTLPVAASLQLGPRFRLFGGAAVIWDDFEPTRIGLDVHAGAGLTFEDKRGAFCEARVKGTTARIQLAGTAAEPPALGFDATILFGLSFYLFDPPDVGRFGDGL